MPPKGATLSEEQRENLRQKARARASERAKLQHAKKKLVAAKLQEHREEVSADLAASVLADPPEPTSEGILSELASLFAKASGEKSGREKAVEDALELLGGLNPMKYPDIADNPKVQAFIERMQSQKLADPNLRPGSYVGTGITTMKKAWSWGDLKKGMNLSVEEVTARNAKGEIIFPWVEYTPIKNTPVIWNGLIVYFRARQKVYCCKVFVDVFEESLNLEEFAEQHAAWLMGNPDAKVHRDYFTTNAPRVRAMNMGKGEYHQPGGGMIGLEASPDLVAMGGGTSGEEK